MNIPLACPHAEYREGMTIHCKQANAPCGHVFFKRCKGWWALSKTADQCPLRREQNGTAEKPQP